MTLNDFMLKKGEAYSNIDTDRMPRFWLENSAKFHQTAIAQSIVQIVGTNGKGSTGRILALAALKSGLKVGHFTSPHIFSFNERFWLNGADADDAALENAHETVLAKIGGWAEKLSYFEYSAVLAIELFSHCDLVILEAGLGGEFDATSVFDQKLLLVTPIDLDHQTLLGSAIEQIAATKLRAMRSNAILAAQPHDEVYRIANEIACERGFQAKKACDLAGSLRMFQAKNAPPFTAINRQLAFAAAKFLHIRTAILDLAVEPIFGRMSKIARNITIDVGHNPHAAIAVAETFCDRQVTLIYNSYSDKEFAAVLRILKPIVKRCLIIEISSPRIAEKSELVQALLCEQIEWADFDGVLDNEEDYLVFGSFSVVEAFMRAFNAR